jgi:hypothetical protein
MRSVHLRRGPGVALAVLAALLVPVAVGGPAIATPGAEGPAAAGNPARVPAPDDTGQAAAATATGAHRVPNPLLKERYANSRRGGPATEADPPVALCATFLGQPNPYRNPAPNVDQIAGDGVTRAGTATGCPTAQNETTIVVNPRNPRHLVAAANDYRDFNTRTGRNDSSGWAYTSFDGGRSWTNVRLPGLTLQTGGVGALGYMDGAGDPALAFGPGNTVYYANLVFSRAIPADGSQSASGITVSVSRDGGLTWGQPVILQIDGVRPDGTPTPASVFNDKEWITADPNSGTVYVTWTRFTYNDSGYLESPIVVAKSTDSGRSFSGPRRISPSLSGFTGGVTPYAQGSNPQVGRDGSLYVAYEASVCATVDCADVDDHNAIVLATSRDGGRTFTNREVALNFDIPATLTGQNFRLNSFPLTAYDWLTDQLWITWADDRNGQYSPEGASIRTNVDVFVIRSQGGRSFSPQWRVGTGADEFFPAVAVFATRVAVSYYTRIFDPDGVKVDYAYSVGWGHRIDGAPLRRITTESQDPRIQFTAARADGSLIQGVFIGDYTGIAMGFDFKIHPCWVDFRGRPGVNTPNQDAYTQAILALF